jgi:hypothetical protein
MFASVASANGTVMVLARVMESNVKMLPTSPGVEPANWAAMVKAFLAEATVIAGLLPPSTTLQVCDPTTRVAELIGAAWLGEGV